MPLDRLAVRSPVMGSVTIPVVRDIDLAERLGLTQPHSLTTFEPDDEAYWERQMTKLTDEELAQEAQRWVTREVDLTGWEDAPEAVPRSAESVAISLHLPKKMLDILREFARREGVGYQVLMKKWLDERIRREAVEPSRPALRSRLSGHPPVYF